MGRAGGWQYLPVRMSAMAKKESYGFTIRQSVQRDGRTGFSVSPSSLLVRLAVSQHCPCMQCHVAVRGKPHIGQHFHVANQLLQDEHA